MSVKAEEINKITEKEKELRKKLGEIRNQNIPLYELPLALEEIYCNLALLKRDKEKIKEELNGNGIKKITGSVVVQMSVNGGEDKKIKIVVGADDLKESIITDEMYVVTKQCPLLNAIKNAKKNDLVVIKTESKGRKITTIIKIEENNTVL